MKYVTLNMISQIDAEVNSKTDILEWVDELYL